MKTLGNIIWVLFGGLFFAIGCFLTGCIFFITVIGIPFGKQWFKIGMLALWPFGKDIIEK